MLLKELQSLALDVKVLTENNDELIIHELDEDDEALPTAAAREAEERDRQTPVEEYDISGADEDEDEDIELGSIFESDDDEDGFNGRDLFSGEEDEDDDDDFGEKFTLFDDSDDDDDGKDE